MISIRAGICKIKRYFGKRIPLTLSLLLCGVCYIFLFLLTKYFPILQKVTTGVIGDFLGTCITVNAGLTFEYVRQAIGKTLLDHITDEISEKTSYLIGCKHPVDNFCRDAREAKENIQTRIEQCSIMIRTLAWGFAGLSLLGMLLADFDFIAKGGICNIIFLWPAFCFCYYLCKYRYFGRKLMKKVYEPVDQLMVAKNMEENAIRKLSGAPSEVLLTKATVALENQQFSAVQVKTQSLSKTTIGSRKTRKSRRRKAPSANHSDQ